MTDRGPRTHALDEDLRELTKSFVKFRTEVRTQLSVIKWAGVFFVGVLLAVATGAGRVVWDAATLTSEVKQHGVRLEKIEKRLAGVDQKLDTLLRRTEPKVES
jgi:hypothetical protein